MIEASPNRHVIRVFVHYIGHILKKNFHTIHLDTDHDSPLSGPAMLIGNHVGWWDGFYAFYLNTQYFKKNFFIMMLEEELQKHRIFQKVGAFSIKKGTRSMLESLNYAKNLLTKHNNLLVFFPQGKLHSLYCTDIRFEKGITRIIDEKRSDSVFFFASFVDYLENKKPTLFLAVRNAAQYKTTPETTFEEAYQKFYAAFLHQQQNLIQ
ncbi:MAG: lysophospholipid acyltransferase family protein [Bacteroidales bacterium]|nr:lysophospholipid acyltransferase family protein [Bacteroidales bacterium]